MPLRKLAHIAAALALTAFAAGCAGETDESGSTMARRRDTSAKTDDGAQKPDETPTTTPGSVTAPDPSKQPVPIVTPSDPPPTKVAPAKPAIACATITDSVTAAYRIALLRAPDPEGLKLWVSVIEDQGESRVGVLRRIIQSEEFTAIRANLTDEEFVVGLYRSFFDREPDAGKAHWLNLLAGGGSRVSAALGFVESDEFRTPSNRAVACFF